MKESPTRRALSHDDISAAVAESFGPEATMLHAEPLTGGGFGAVWRVRVGNGDGECELVLKAAPRPGARLLTYEAGLLGAEARYLRTVETHAPEIPMPRVLAESPEYVFMTMLPGTSLPALATERGDDALDTVAARYASGAHIARLHQITGDRFGYPDHRPAAGNWPDAIEAMFGAMLGDAVSFGVTFPVPPERIRAAVAAQRDVLALVPAPSLLHFDLWDGNLLAEAGPDGVARLTGIVDGERYLWGDPLVDFVSPKLFHDIADEPEHPFVRGYASVRPVSFGPAERRRLWVYQLYLYVLMMTEFPSRGMSPAAEPEFWALLEGLVSGLTDRLADPAGAAVV